MDTYALSPPLGRGFEAYIYTLGPQYWRLELTSLGGWLSRSRYPAPGHSSAPTSNFAKPRIAEVLAASSHPSNPIDNPIEDIGDQGGRQGFLQQVLDLLNTNQLVIFDTASQALGDLFIEPLLRDLTQCHGWLYRDGVLCHHLCPYDTVDDVLHSLVVNPLPNSATYRVGRRHLNQSLQTLQGLVVLRNSHLSSHDLGLLLASAPHCSFLVETASAVGPLAAPTLAPEVSQEMALKWVEREFSQPLTPLDRISLTTLWRQLQGNWPIFMQQVHWACQGKVSLLMVERHSRVTSPPDYPTRLLLDSLSLDQRDLLSRLAALGGGPVTLDALVNPSDDLTSIHFLLEQLRRQHLVSLAKDYGQAGATSASPRYQLAANLLPLLQNSLAEAEVAQAVDRLFNWLSARSISEIAAGDLMAGLELIHSSLQFERYDWIRRLTEVLVPLTFATNRWGLLHQLLVWQSLVAQQSQDLSLEATAGFRLGLLYLCGGQRAQANKQLQRSLKLANKTANTNQAEAIRRHLGLLAEQAPPFRPPVVSPPLAKIGLGAGLVAITLALGLPLLGDGRRARPAPLSFAPTLGLSPTLNPTPALEDLAVFSRAAAVTPPPRSTPAPSPQPPTAAAAPSPPAPVRQQPAIPSPAAPRPTPEAPPTASAPVPPTPGPILADPAAEFAPEATQPAPLASTQRLSPTLCSAAQAQWHEADSEAQRSLLEAIMARGQCP